MHLASESGRTCWLAGSPRRFVRSLTSVLYMFCARFTHIDLKVWCLSGRNTRGLVPAVDRRAQEEVSQNVLSSLILKLVADRLG